MQKIFAAKILLAAVNTKLRLPAVYTRWPIAHFTLPFIAKIHAADVSNLRLTFESNK
jgi:hypothetical protein